MAQRERRGRAVLLLSPGCYMGVGGQRHAPAALLPGRDPVPTVQEAGWTPEPVWTGAENLASTGIRSPDRPSRSSVAIPTELLGPLHLGGSHNIQELRYDILDWLFYCDNSNDSRELKSLAG